MAESEAEDRPLRLVRTREKQGGRAVKSAANRADVNEDELVNSDDVKSQCLGRGPGRKHHRAAARARTEARDCDVRNTHCSLGGCACDPFVREKRVRRSAAGGTKQANESLCVVYRRSPGTDDRQAAGEIGGSGEG